MKNFQQIKTKEYTFTRQGDRLYVDINKRRGVKCHKLLTYIPLYEFIADNIDGIKYIEFWAYGGTIYYGEMKLNDNGSLDVFKEDLAVDMLTYMKMVDMFDNIVDGRYNLL